MDYQIIFILFVLGLIIGSFLNVVILRFNTGAKIVSDRSRCFSCGKTLLWYELVPLFSFLFQLGRCRHCGTKISWQYPVVELLGGIALPLSYLFTLYTLPQSSPAPWLESAVFICSASILCLYIVMGVYDVRHKIIPDVFSCITAIFALILLAIRWWGGAPVTLGDWLAGPILFSFFFFFWFVSRGTWMGLGDAKLALSVGWVLGLSKGISAILLAFWIGAAISLIVMALGRLFRSKGSLHMKSEVPFGPYILLGFVIAFAFPYLDIQSILSFLAV